mmetsp:Transcript_22145/g.68187  ORF Transcript_22145/g.68187 Transcript_22145/m.68187 type:complete len:195 (+) Transcript_22145:449-1033(+)
MASIRPVALAVIRRPRDGAVLVFEGGNGKFHRPLGGGIEFGETAERAVHRELKEELGAELTDVRRIGVLENLFWLDGARGHEIVFVFAAAFKDTELYDLERLAYVEDDEQSEAIWVLPADARANPDGPPLYPDGLLALLREEERRRGRGSRRGLWDLLSSPAVRCGGSLALWGLTLLFLFGGRARVSSSFSLRR